MARFKRLKELFRPKPREQRPRPPLLYYFIVAVMIILILNFALLLPPQLSTLFFEFELLVIQFLRMPIIMQTWTFLIVIVVVALVGTYAIPELWVPATRDRYLIRDSWEEGDLRYFKTLTGKIIVVHKKLVRNRLLRKVIIGPVARIPQWKYIIYQTEQFELSQSLMWKRVAETLMEENRKLHAALGKTETYLTLQEVMALIEARKGGGSGEKE